MRLATETTKWDPGARRARLSAARIGVLVGQRRWRWDLNPRRGCPLTRFRGVRPRPLGDSTAGELTRIRAGASDDLPGIPPSRREEITQQVTALGGEDAADDFRAVVKAGVAQHVPER